MLLSKLIKYSKNYDRNKTALRFLASRASLNKERNEEVIQRILSNLESNDIKNCDLIRKKLLENERNFNRNNVDSTLVNYCFTNQYFSLAHDYIHFLRKENLKSDLLTSGQLLRLYFFRKYYDQDTEEDERNALHEYDKLRKQYEILDPISTEAAILGLSVTKRWKDSIGLIEELKNIDTPGNNAYNAIVWAAFKNGDDETAYKYLDEIVDNDRVPMEISYYSAVQSLDNLDPEKFKEKLDTFLSYCQKHNLILTKKVVQLLKDLSQKLGFKVSFTGIDKHGECKFCSNQLKKLQITLEEFLDLKEKMESKVIIGRDIFNRTNPGELDRFKDFLREIKGYDVVVDGLNVAYSSGAKQNVALSAGLLRSVVQHFVNRNKRVAVLGRVHMRRWPKTNWGFVEQKAKTFLTEDISQDDPYLLYSALHCGPDAIIVSRDLMRSHRFMLKETKDRKNFDRWLEQRKYELIYVNAKGTPVFKVPHPYTRISQKVDKSWHVPYDTANSDENEEEHWLCVTLHKI